MFFFFKQNVSLLSFQTCVQASFLTLCIDWFLTSMQLYCDPPPSMFLEKEELHILWPLGCVFAHLMARLMGLWSSHTAHSLISGASLPRVWDTGTGCKPFHSPALFRAVWPRSDHIPMLWMGLYSSCRCLNLFGEPLQFGGLQWKKVKQFICKLMVNVV